MADSLLRAGFKAAAIHGNKSQGARERALAGFKSGEIRVLVATDIAARGIDVDDLSHVINYDMPDDPESYVHRIGRTGRAGRTGVALSFCTPHERGDLHAIERLSRLRIAPVELPRELAGRGPTGQPQPMRTPERARDTRAPERARDSGRDAQAPLVERAPRPGYAPPRRRRAFA